MRDIIAAYSIICDLKAIANKKAKIRPSRKLPDVQYYCIFISLHKLLT